MQKKIINVINNANNILLVAHEKPDIDTTSSVCSLKEFLNNIKKKSSIYCFDKIPHQFNFLSNSEIISSNIPNIDSFDTIITCDCGNYGKTKLNKILDKKNTKHLIINLDHHPKTDNFADYEIKDTEAVATTEIIYLLFKANNIKLNKKIAECILAGILTDTKNFLYTKTSSKALLIAAEMIKLGADWSKIMSHTYYNKCTETLKLWGETMYDLELNKKYKIASANIPLKKLESIDQEKLEGLPSLLGTIKGIKGVIFLKEQSDDSIRGSLRSFDSSINMSLLANSLGGGGHIKAAGFNTKGHLKRTEKKWIIIDNNG